MSIVFNLNQSVTVVLTESGAKTHNNRWRSVIARMPAHCRPVEKKAGDKLRTQMWSLMQDFGPSIVIGMEPPFEGNNIEMDPAS